MFDNEDCDGYPVESMGSLSGFGMGALAYLPDLGPVGSGSAGTYYPRDTSGDAAALNYLGFFPDFLLQAHVGTSGSQAADMAAFTGAWSEPFKTAVGDFQLASNLTADGWIGPGTRTELARQVALKNANEIIPPGPLPIPPGPLPFPPGPLPFPPGPLPFPPAPGPSPAPGPGPGPAPADDHTGRNVALVAGGLAVAGGLYYLLKKKK